ncbi:MAG: GNAT family N-acetyltransferase [Verrucomicrobiota bacterium]
MASSTPSAVLPSSQAPQFQPASPGDAIVVRQMAEEIWYLCYPGIITQQQIDFMLDWMYAPEKLADEIADPEIEFGFLVQDDDAVGYASYGPENPGDRKAGHLHKFYLHPRKHGQGLGSAALREIIRLARSQGYESLSLRVNRANQAAVRCYEHCDFVIEREVCSDIGNGFVMDDFWMSRVL